MAKRPLLEGVRGSLHRELDPPPGALLLVAVSGGLDSVVLLHLLRRVAPDLSLSLHVAHLDHRLRGRASGDDADFVARLARDWGLPATIAAADVAAYRRRGGLSLEAAARAVRYAFLAALAAQTGALAVCVGHTADDQVETVLLHLLRGAGLAGMRGMAARQQLTVRAASSWSELPLNGGAESSLLVLRPLLDRYRVELAEYAALNELAYRQDASNADLSLTRNRVRHRLLPRLEEVNPAGKAAVARSARLLADDYAFLVQSADHSWCALAQEDEARVVFPLAGFQAVPVALRRLLVRRAAARLAPVTEATLGAAHVESVLDLAASGRTGSAVHLPAGLRAIRSYDTILLLADQGEAESLGATAVALAVPGVTAVGRWRVKASLRAAPCCPGGDPLHADLDLERVGVALSVRRRQPGDRVALLGGGSKKLQDVFVDNKLPRAERDAVPVVVADAERVVWAVGQAVDQTALARAETRQVLCLTFSKGAR